MKKIFWLTADNFYDVDVPIVPEIAKQYTIDWHIFLGYNKCYNEDDIVATSFPQSENLTVSVYKSKIRARNPKRILEYLKLIRKIKKGNYDVVYVDMFDMSYLFPLLYVCRVKKVIYACHDFDIHVGFQHGTIAYLLKKFNFACFKNFQFFSNTTYKQFVMKYPSKNVFMSYLALKDFGKSELTPATNKIVFTYFGTIRENKGVEYLIEAGNKLYETHKGKFIINIFGYTPEWGKYEKRIKNSKAFNLDIRKIENSEIPNIFCSSHFIVLPYKDVSQSGVLSIAYNYCVPAICPDFEGFREYVKSKNNGFLFKSMNSSDLYNTMKYVIEHFYDYPYIKQNLENFVEQNYSLHTIVNEYIKFFNILANAK